MWVIRVSENQEAFDIYYPFDGAQDRFVLSKP